MIRETVTLHTDDNDEKDVIIVDAEAFKSIDTSGWEELQVEMAEEDLAEYGVAFINADTMEQLDRYFDYDDFYVLIDYVFEHYPHLKEKFETERAIRDSEDPFGLKNLQFSDETETIQNQENEDDMQRYDPWNYEGVVLSFSIYFMSNSIEYDLYSRVVDGQLKYQIRDKSGKAYVVTRNPRYDSRQRDDEKESYYKYKFGDSQYFNAD